MTLKKFGQLVIAIFICQSAGLIGSFFTVPAIPTWYAGLVKPVFNPPPWLFGPVWTLLYTLMGIALYLLWQKRQEKQVKSLMIVFLVHLFFNATWSIVFFGLQNIWLALANIIILWLFIVYLIIKAWSYRRWVSYLLIPYLLWVSFASVLNFSIRVLN